LTDTFDTAKRIRTALYDIIDYYAAALNAGGTGARMRIKASKEAPLPVSAHILDVRAEACTRLAGWAQVVLEGRDLRYHQLSTGDALGLGRFLVVHADWLAGEAGTDPADELETSARDLKSIVLPHRREWMPLGVCPLVTDSPDGPIPCTGTVRAYPTCDPYCDKCGVEAVVSWWERVMFADPELTRLVTAPELVVAIHREFGRVVVEATIRQWVARGVIEPSGSDEKGRTLYDRAGVIYALTRRQVLA